MRVSNTPEDFQYPTYQYGCEGFWDLTERLRSETQFTNSEINNEGIYTTGIDFR